MGLWKIFDIKLDQWVWREQKKLVMASVLIFQKAWKSKTKAPKMQCPPRVIFFQTESSPCAHMVEALTMVPIASYNAIHSGYKGLYPMAKSPR